jgi:hypothetical protein
MSEMTTEKAKNILATNKWHGQEKTTIEHNEALEIALTALEKQVPKEVDESSLNYSNLPVSRCPICVSSGISPYKDRYCFNCGQALSWPEVGN